jgi:hypothetical protein
MYHTWDLIGADVFSGVYTQYKTFLAKDKMCLKRLMKVKIKFTVQLVLSLYLCKLMTKAQHAKNVYLCVNGNAQNVKNVYLHK